MSLSFSLAHDPSWRASLEGFWCRANVRLLVVVLLASLAVAVRADVPQYRSGVFAEPSLLSFYPFDGDSGSKALDQVPSAQNGVLTGATFSTAAGTMGSQSIQGARVALGPGAGL